MSKHICVVGLQWGDEGKGKITDHLSKNVDAVVRFQGGGNAGHTVYVNGQKYVLHHIPVGILHDNVYFAILGNGMVIEPRAFLEEYKTLTPVQRDKIRISDRAHITLGEHLERDVSRETDRNVTTIGSTRRGIGPTYEDKYARFGLRAGDLRRAETIQKLPLKDREVLIEFYELVGHNIVDTLPLLYDLDRTGCSLLFEGAQGVLLDVDFGQYPYVTSSHCTFLGLGPGTGFSPRKIDRVIGIAKAYPTRVGTGPFPSAAEPEDDEWLRNRGNEYGATTGRPRKCGWLDIPALRYAVRVSDVDEVALTKVDILDDLNVVPVCTGYSFRGVRLCEFPSDTQVLEEVEPIFTQWDNRSYEDFASRLEVEIGCKVSLIGCGPDRTNIIER